MATAIKMKLGTVIGRVTLSRSVEALKGGRFLVVSPFSRGQYAAGLKAKPAMGLDPSIVVYDNLGGGKPGPLFKRMSAAFADYTRELAGTPVL